MLLQALANYRNSGTGQLSAATAFMLFFGSTARIFTSIQETGDTMVIITYVAAASVNFIIAAQVVYYWNKSAPAKTKAKSKKGGKKAAKKTQ
uniref:Mannose-P-dolichol utilization defect 1 protein homolog n=2 Tax=Timema TaxID=61471 RepID=A0A7R9AT10_TIMSH|nr:unnamed protein product [Timema douglasi]CAD7259912.1 unnamed protein product [Timema shepardi]